MTLNIIFAFSGLVIAALIGAKVWEEKHKRRTFLLALISRGDERVRDISHSLAHRYAEWKDDAHFFIKKQLPLHTKNIVNKTSTLVKERVEKHVGDIRGSRFLKKSDGISEFFKSLAEKENGGRIDDTLDFEGSQDGDKRVE